MKLFAFIFSFYLLALAVMPCSDKEDCNYQNTEQTSLATSDHTNHDSDTEHCSPFCMCACCGQSYSNTFSYSSLSVHIPLNAKDFPIYNASFVSEVYLSIWQPPKIS